MKSVAALGLSGVLAASFALQPLLVKLFVAPEASSSSFVLASEAVKCALCLALLTGDKRRRPALESWSLREGLAMSGLPSAVYALQNLVTCVAFRRLDGMTFGVLNQTKLLFTAFFVFALRGMSQSRQQCFALVFIFASSVTIALQDKACPDGSCAADFLVGTLAAVVGAALAGLGGVLSEVALVQRQRDVLLFSTELSVGGMALVAVNLLLDLNGDGAGLREGDASILSGWTLWTMLPVATNACGGILVGLVTKALGSIRKAFTVTLGLLLAAILRIVLERQLPSLVLVVASSMAMVGVLVYCGGASDAEKINKMGAMPSLLPLGRPAGMCLACSKMGTDNEGIGLVMYGPAPSSKIKEMVASAEAFRWVGAYQVAAPAAPLSMT